MAGNEWDGEPDRLSFDDSERFEEDESVCSWMSDTESCVDNNWRGWQKIKENHDQDNNHLFNQNTEQHNISSLQDLSAQCVALHIPFEIVENYNSPPVPAELQQKISFWSFPHSEEDIRLYSCLATGSADEFQRGEMLYKQNAVREVLQIGFQVIAKVSQGLNISTNGNPNNFIPRSSQLNLNSGEPRPGASVTINAVSAPFSSSQMNGPNAVASEVRVSIMFDRRRVVRCFCTCSQTHSWCQHVVAVCLYRIIEAKSVVPRAPISESLALLDRGQLQKFAQYLVSGLYATEILPIAQNLLDQLLNRNSEHNVVRDTPGAPDPTSGASAGDKSAWYLDCEKLMDNVGKILAKFCVPSPVVFSDPTYLSSNLPAAAQEYQHLLRPLRGREPEGIWNLLSIIRETMRRRDNNSIQLLEVLTEQILSTDVIVHWWFCISLSTSHNVQIRIGSQNNLVPNQYAAAAFCDELVSLWRLVVLDPRLSVLQRRSLEEKLHVYHRTAQNQAQKGRFACTNGATTQTPIKPRELELFSGFKPAFETCHVSWEDFPHIDDIPFSLLSMGLVTTPPSSERLVVRRARHRSRRQTATVVQHVEPSDLERSSSSEGFYENFGAARLTSDSSCESPSSSNLESVARRRLEFGADSVLTSTNNDDGNKVCSSTTTITTTTNTCDSRQDVLFCRCQALYAHGFPREASVLARQLSQALLLLPSNFLVVNLSTAALTGAFPSGVLSQSPGKSSRKKQRAGALSSVSHGASAVASTTDDICIGGSNITAQDPAQQALELCERALFLSRQLSLEQASGQELAFKLLLWSLRLRRPPARNRSLEVRLMHQESELMALLKRLPVNPAGLAHLSQLARDICVMANVVQTTHIPLPLATYLLETLSVVGGSVERQLGFEAAVAALGMKSQISEFDHPLLCEGLRRQRDELATILVVQYKDDVIRLTRVLDQLLDRTISRHFKAPPLDTCLHGHFYEMQAFVTQLERNQDELAATTAAAASNAVNVSTAQIDASSAATTLVAIPTVASQGGPTSGDRTSDSSAVEDDELEAQRLRCAQLRRPTALNRSVVDSSAPETTSSDNSPTLVRRHRHIMIQNSVNGSLASPHDPMISVVSRKGDNSDSSSCGGQSSSDSDTAAAVATVACSTSNEMPAGQRSMPGGLSVASSGVHQVPNHRNSNNTSSPVWKTWCNGASNNNYANSGGSNIRHNVASRRPTEPNKPSESMAHHMFELARTILNKAGGSSVGSHVFQQAPATAPGVASGPHRNLQLSAFLVGFYALGLYNCVNNTWQSRTYSSHVSWISNLVMEIGSVGVSILLLTWKEHLTPPEVASIADKASRSRDASITAAAAELCLACLEEAQTLNPQEIQRALAQCKDQSNVMLEKGLYNVQAAAEKMLGGVHPQVLFDVARQWYELWESARAREPSHSTQQQQQQFQQQQQQQQQQLQQQQFAAHAHHVAAVSAAMGAHAHHFSQTAMFQGAPQGPYPGATMFPTYGPPMLVYQPLPAAVYARGSLLAQAGPGPTPMAQMPQAIIPHRHHHHHRIPAAAATVSPNARSNLVHPLQASHENVSAATATSPMGKVFRYLENAFSCATRAMKSVYQTPSARNDTALLSNSRDNSRFGANPPHAIDVQWTLLVAKQLGAKTVIEYCSLLQGCVHSPDVLERVASEVFFYHQRCGQSSTDAANCATLTALNSELNKIITRMHKLFQLYIDSRLTHLSQHEWDELVQIILRAQKAKQMFPPHDPNLSFNALLTHIRKHNKCKKELWSRIMAGLHTVAL